MQYELMVDGFRWKLYAEKEAAEAAAKTERRRSSVHAAWVEEREDSYSVNYF